MRNNRIKQLGFENGQKHIFLTISSLIVANLNVLICMKYTIARSKSCTITDNKERRCKQTQFDAL